MMPVLVIAKPSKGGISLLTPFVRPALFTSQMTGLGSPPCSQGPLLMQF